MSVFDGPDWSWGYCRHCRYLVLLDGVGNRIPHHSDAMSSSPCNDRTEPDPTPDALDDYARLYARVNSWATDANNPENGHD